MKIGEKIEFYRKEANLTQKQLGKKAGLAENTICNYELGKTSPNFDALVKISEVLKIPLKNLVLDNQHIITEKEYEEIKKAIETLEKIIK